MQKKNKQLRLVIKYKRKQSLDTERSINKIAPSGVWPFKGATKHIK